MVFALAGETGNILFAGKISLMAEITAGVASMSARALLHSLLFDRTANEVWAAATSVRYAAMLRRSSSVSPCIAWFTRFDDAQFVAEHERN